MKKFLSALLALVMVLSLVIPSAVVANAEDAGNTTQFVFLDTSDLHGQIYATDYTAAQESSGTYKRGLTRVATYIDEVRATYGAENVFVADSGDTIQGTPFTYYYAFNKTDVEDPAIKAMRTIGYDMWVVGNHEFNYSLDILNRQLDYATSASTATEKQMAVSMANYLDAATNSDASKDWATWKGYAPYIIREFDGVKVAIMGLGNPNVPKWDSPDKWEGIYFANPIDTYLHYEAEMDAASDMIVVIAHSGIGSDAGSDYMERLVAQTNTISFGFSGHEHGNQVWNLTNKDGKTVPVLQPYTKARAIGQVVVTYNKDTNEYTLDASVPNMENYAIDEDLAAVLKPYEDATWNEYMNNVLGQASADYSAANLGTAPSAFMDLINQVQMWGAYDRTGTNTPDDTSDDTIAQLSISAPLTSGSNPNLIPAGDITLGQLFSLYRYENWFYQITMSGEEVHQWLEFAATKIQIDEEGNPFVSSGDLTYYDVIYGEGFSYTIDYTAPKGMRIVSMTYNGKEVAADDVFTVVVNNYRYNGGGNYVAYLNANGCDFVANDENRVIYSTQFDMASGEDLGQARSLLQAYIEEKGVITPEVKSTWKLVDGGTANDITILFTNDIHTYIDGALSYDNIAALKEAFMAAGSDTVLVDAGDHIQGTAYGSMDKGATIIKLMNAAGYDFATLGNHEFDYGMEGALASIAAANFQYLSANFYDLKNDKLVLPAYSIVELEGKKVAFVGMTTPESFTKSTPAYFQDGNGNYIYDIFGGTDGAALYNSVQKAIDEAKAAGAEIVIGLAHLGVDLASQPWTSVEVIANTTGLDAVIDGHSHSTVNGEIVKDKAGNDVILAQTGSYFDAIGQMTIAPDGAIAVELIKSYEGSVEEVAAIQDAWIAEIQNQLGVIIGKAEVVFDNYDEEGKRLVRSQETNTGDFAADALYYLFDNMGLDVDLAIMNGGGVRNKAITGEMSYLTCKNIHTFGNVACLITVTGQQILDALEWGVREIGTAECGGFLHVSGITYDVHTYIESTVQKDDKGVWTGGPTGAYRVKDVKVYNKETGKWEDLDLDAKYNMAGYNYTLRDLGDGFAMFGGAVNVLDYVMEDYMVLANYVKGFKDCVVGATNSPLAAKYKNFAVNYGTTDGTGRIVQITEIVTPPTGDVTNVALLIGLAVSSLCGMGITLGAKKKF